MKLYTTTRFLLAIGMVLFCAFFAVLPFFGSGFIPTHDGEFHFIRFAEFFRMLQTGYLFPRWAPTINSGYGLPVFEFLYPFANYISSMFHVFGMEFVGGFKISSALGYLIAVLFCFLWLKKRFGLFPAAIGTIASAYVPYWFVELFVRGAIGEVWAIAFVFLALWTIEMKRPIWFALAIAGIILSHNILTIIFGPFFILYLHLRRDWKWIWFMLLGAGLAAWFWLPAIMESKYMVGLNTVNYKDHFASVAELLIPSWGTAFSGPGYIANKMSFQIGIGPILWLIAAGLLMLSKRIKTNQKREVLGLFVLIVLVLYMTLPQSTVIWELIPFMAYIQHPWRFLVYLIPVTAYIAAVVAGSIKTKWIAVIVAVVSVAVSFSYTRGAVYEPRNDAYYLTNPNFTDSASSMGNSLSTVWTSWKENRSLSIVTDTFNNPLSVVVQKERYLDRLYQVNLEAPLVVRLHILYFPGWTVFVDGKKAVIDYTANGTLDIAVPAGTHVIRAVMVETPVRYVSNWISVVSLVIAAGLGILLYTNRKKV
jgi:hypothetical protein